MKLLHTSDWHVGKTLKGRDRTDECLGVLSEIVDIAAREAVDLVVVSGDLFDTAAPPPKAEQIVYKTLLELAEIAPVGIVAGNHDHERRLQAVKPLLKLGRVTTRALAADEDDRIWRFEAATGEPVNLALLPWLSHSFVIRSPELMDFDADEHQGIFASRVKAIVQQLVAGFTPDAVNLVAAHLMMAGADTTGSERTAHTIFEYCVSAAIFSPEKRDEMTPPHYVGLGHVHRQQQLPSGTPVWYSGSPMMLDFGETDDTKGVLIVEASPGVPATVRPVPLTTTRTLRRIEGTLDQIAALAGTTGDDYLRIVVREQARAGLADEVRAIFGESAIDVIVEAKPQPARERVSRSGRTPHDLFVDYLNEKSAHDERVVAMFDRLHDETSDASVTA